MRSRHQKIQQGVLVVLVTAAALTAHAAISTRWPARAAPAAPTQVARRLAAPARPLRRGARAVQAHILSHPRPTAWQRWDGVLHRVWRWATRAHPLSGRW